ncbi:hypothetical protein CDCA_CDCA10G3081 [Cyanidium caldarium]|uniref:Replication factor C subunit 1 n=1 Tax=Cyanidium caldarium TaxID=2771 RepID=A0AAV9IY93_CYACA|nr:hypothetical protein CDCA_CDCA10G3081 [Cyanidium caldarium]
MPTDPAVPDGKDEADIAAMTSSGGRLGGRRRLRRAQEAGVAGASRESPSRRSLQGGPAGGERASASKGEGRRRRAVQDDDADDGDNAYVPEDAEEEAEIEPQTPVRRPRKREAAANAERTPKRVPSSGRRVGRGHGEPAVGVEERHDGNDDDDGVEVDDLPSTARRPSRAETYRNYLQHQMEVDSPPLRGKKPPPPTGAPDCLAGLNFCITGVMDSLTRTEMEDLVRAHGGHIAKSVTRNLQYLVAGADPGPRKMEEARKRSAVEVVDEDGVFALIRRRSAAASTPARRLSMGETSPPPPPPPPYNASKARKPPSPPRPRTTAGQRAATAATIGAPARTSELWTVKYRPRVPEDLIANPGVLKQLSDWLDQWQQVYGDGAAAKTKSSVPRAALLAGPPGLGKSSAAHVVVRHKGMEPIEFNASDTRSKSALQTHVTELIRSHNIDRYAVATLARNASDTGASASQARSVTRAHLCGNRGHVLIMDEVDGMSAGDRGGMAELNKLIKTSRVPIICICNDDASANVRTLKFSTLFLKFRRPMWSQVRKRLLQIAHAEQMPIDDAALEKLAETCKGDVRQMITLLQWYHVNRPSRLTYMDVKAAMDVFGKTFEEQSIFQAFSVFFRSPGPHLPGQTPRVDPAREASVPEAVRLLPTLSEMLDVFYMDPDLMPLMIQENYLLFASGKRNSPSAPFTLSCVSRAAQALSDSDLLNESIRRRGRWDLSNALALFAAVLPGHYMAGPQMVERASFPSWLGKNSTTTKNARLLAELELRVKAAHCPGGALGCAVTRPALRLDYLPTLSDALIRPLLQQGADGAATVCERLDAYYLSLDDWRTVTSGELQLEARRAGHARLAEVSAAVKSALTRYYRQRSHPVSTMSVVHAGASVGARAPAGRVLSEDAVAEEPDAEDEGETAAEEEGASAPDTANDALVLTRGKDGARGGGGKPSRGGRRGRGR